MTYPLVKRLASFAAVSLAALLLSLNATAAPKNGLPVLQNPAAARTADLPAFAKAKSGISGTLSPGVLSAPVLELTLPDGTTIQAGLQRVASDAAKGRQSWIGTFADAPGSALILSRVKGVVTGMVNYKDQVLQILPAAGGKHVLFAVDSAKLPAKFEELRRPQPTSGDTLAATATDYGTGGSTLTAADNVVQDVLVLYTAATATKYGQASIESQIQSAVQAANQAYQNSLVHITLNLVAMQQSKIVEQGGMNATLDLLQSDSTTANLRNQVGADMVVLVDEDTDYCGLSNLMTSNSTSFASYAFSVVHSSCLSNQSLAHELGHQQGNMHDRADSGYAGVYPYSYGYRVCVTDGTGFRDVMSYPCSSVPRVLVFSNPNVTWNGYPAGISYESDPSNSAETARSMNNTATTVAAFRTSSTTTTTTSTAPAAPSGMSILKSSYNSVTVGWTDNSSNETGFKLERSTDGVNFTEIATLGANTVSYTDGTVAAKTTYYFRVRAYNSYGVSSYSSTASVTTPDAPPPPPPAPTSVAASDNKNGSATVSWTVGTTNASGFDVQRETYNSKNGSWGSATIAASVPSTVLSIIDTVSAGTYRYSVRATNSGGASAYTGPVQVTVTSSTTTTTLKKGRGRK